MTDSQVKLRNVLVIAYYFPPMGLSGVQRTLKFVKYLPQFGWQPTVLTVTPTGYFAQDYTLLDELHPNHVEIERVGSLDPNRLFRKKGVVKMPSEKWRKLFSFISDTFFIPDNKIGWKRKAIKKADELFLSKNFDVIYATAPPFTDFVIGTELHKKYKKPLVIDYRDPWHDYPYKHYPTPLHKLVNYKLEKKTLKSSSRVLVTSRRTKELILKRFKFLEYHDVTILSHGYDPADLNDNPKIHIEKTNRMRISHAGVFYADRTPKYMFEALRNLFRSKPELKNQIELYLIGTLQDEFVKMIHKLGLEGNVHSTGYLDHNHCIAHLKTADVLWLTMNNDAQSPGKLYEYLGLMKPILATVRQGFVAQTLKESGGATIVSPTNVEEIQNTIIQLFEFYKQKKFELPKKEMVEKFNRVELTNELSKIFGFLVNE
ncbi:MAG: glycosyltransferase [Ignavibacteriales bacterium]|nr:glycosyltransferase [Ignavibacteriales bacterium]